MGIQKVGALSVSAVGICGIAVLASPIKPLDGATVVDRLFQLHNSVLQDIELTQPKIVKVKTRNGETIEVKRGEFGASRLLPFVPGHPEMSAEAKDQEAFKRAKTATNGWREWVFLGGNKTKPLDSESLKFNRSRGWGAILGKIDYPDETDARPLGLLALRNPSGRAVRTSGKWYWEARTVKAMDKECLNCHVGTRLGDPVGVLVYALYPDPTRTADPGRPPQKAGGPKG